ncbi:uncharacterized protein [Penaeus vannamei]|uniref:uncharacterized protein n=1 Tax=Penaeus vannamei TaxID=6689 RepID=UPI00387F65C5
MSTAAEVTFLDTPQISVKISPIKRLCREEIEAAGETRVAEATDGAGDDQVVACPTVLNQLFASHQRADGRGGRAGVRPPPPVAAVRRRLASRPYWRRCLCSPLLMPTVGEGELRPLLALTPPHRFVVIVVTDTNSSSQASVVVGGESLLEAVYAAQSIPGLRPCLQSPSEPSLAFVKYDLSRPRPKRKKRGERKPTAQTMLNEGDVAVGMVLIYQQTRMLYSGFPLASYGCYRQEFLRFVSKYTQCDFHLRCSSV